MCRNLPANRLHIWFESIFGDHSRVEVAVSALRLAKRHLDVDSERHDRKSNDNTAEAPEVQAGSGTTLTYSFRSRGPSNSHKKIPCQRPSAILPPSTNMVWHVPTRIVLICESELPSACR